MALSIELWENQHITLHIPPSTKTRTVTLSVAQVKSDRKVSLTVQAPGDIKIIRPEKTRRNAKLPDEPTGPRPIPPRPNLES